MSITKWYESPFLLQEMLIRLKYMVVGQIVSLIKPHFLPKCLKIAAFSQLKASLTRKHVEMTNCAHNLK